MPNSPEQVRINHHQIDLWITVPGDITDADLLQRYDHLLTKEERQRQQRYLLDTHRHDALITRAFARTVVAKYTDTPPQDLKFSQGPKGKPELNHPKTAVQFNISHTHNCIVCAVILEQDIGIDIEHTGRKIDIANLAKRNFSATENQQLFALPQKMQRQRFFDYWTVKESYIKACGEGLSVPLNQFSVVIPDKKNFNTDLACKVEDDVKLQFSGERLDKTEHWNSWILEGTREHKIAITVKNIAKFDYQIRCYQYTPLQSIIPITLPLRL